MADKIEDSLENLSDVKRRSISPSNKDQKQKQYLYSLKQKFINALAKLQSSETREIALLEIKRIMDKNREPDFIRMYLALMKSLKVQGTTSSTKQHQILVFSHMSDIFKENLIDPLDRPPSKIKTVFRIIQMLHLYFNDPSNTVQQACARVLIDLGKNVLGTEKQGTSIDPETVINLLFMPLASILKNGVDKGSQATAAVCINQLINYWRNNCENSLYSNILKKIGPQLLVVSLRLNCQYHDFFEALSTIIEFLGMQFFGQKLYQFVSKMLGVINRLHKNNETTNFNSYMCKVNVCLIIQKIGTFIKDSPEIKKKLDELDVIPSLQKASRNRIIQVQMAANKAIKIWNGEQIPPEQPRTPSKSNRGSVMSLQNARNDLKRKRSTSRDDKIQIQKQLNHMKQDLDHMVKGGWGAHQRANNYVKKNSGVGGGNCSKLDNSPQNKAGKSHKQEIEALRQYIKNNSKKYGQDEKFVFYEENKKAQKPNSQQQQRQRKNQSAQNLQKPVKKRQANEDSIDFQLEENEGDQGAVFIDKNEPANPYAQDYEQPKNLKRPDSQKPRSNNIQKRQNSKNSEYGDLPQISLHNSQLKELQQREQQLIEWGKSKMLENPNEFEAYEILTQNQEPFHQKEAADNSQDVPNKPPRQKNNEKLSLNNSLSIEELSDLSSNMLDILNESDLREAIEAQDSFNTDPLKEQIAKISTQKPSFQKNKEKEAQVQQSNVSLAISQSKYVPRQKKPEQSPSESVQFTLNPSKKPQSKFDTFSNQNEDDEDIEEMIRYEDENLHETDHQVNRNGRSDIPVQNPKKQSQYRNTVQELYRKTVDHGEQINNMGKNRRSKFDNNGQNQIFQQMIKNPPKSMINHVPDHPQNFRGYKSEQSAQQSEIELENNSDNITDQWQKILNLVEDEEYNEAFTLAFEMEDHIYLLRLMLITQVPLKKLTPINVCKLWEKFLQIYKYRFIDQIFVQMFTTANQLQGSRGIKSCLSIEETNDLLVELYELSGRSKGKLSFNAAVLYNEVDESINGNRH